ncbi:zinc finger protein CONSTANS-LIKE 2-like [Curcuma longa]|uniref:zinc finger protein CONSTANS-LIKE 2-like n=1 Tax=Curcuma longa TaxID=136217 RepID=UPI003D9EFB4B
MGLLVIIRARTIPALSLLSTRRSRDSVSCSIYCSVAEPGEQGAAHKSARHHMIASFVGMPRQCDVCRSAPSLVYCHADAAFICVGCDERVHTANRLASRHERVWVCEACGRAPAALACCADSAVLCTACDAEVHSANVLAHRHYRVPISPLSFLPGEEGEHLRYGDKEAESWLLINRRNSLFNDQDQMDEYMNLDRYNNNCNETQNQERQNKVSNCHSVSFASMDVSLVPDTTMAEISNSHHSAKGSMELFSTCPPSLPVASQFPLDREAKVLKYREKRKSRKFEKTTRYASRKAYAETRPRSKGRFVKRSDASSESSYGVVPSV